MSAGSLPKSGGLSPMMQQYREVKERHKNELLFYRLGDFYEMFFEDALVASKELELTLTGRDCGLPERAPMCGVPYHSCEGYIARLIEKGYKVAICEQLEDPKETKGIVKRDVIRVVTPGTLLENHMLDEGKNNFIAAVAVVGGGCGIALADVSTGEVKVSDSGTLGGALDDLMLFAPSEVLLAGEIYKNEAVERQLIDKTGCAVSDWGGDMLPQPQADKLILERFSTDGLSAFSDMRLAAAKTALSVLLPYIEGAQRRGFETLNALKVYNRLEHMRLDSTAVRNLEITRTLRTGERRGSLFWVLDRTKTAMGKRLLRSFIDHPLISHARIVKRQNAVDELYRNTVLLGECREALSGVFDIERLMARVSFGNASPRDLKALEQTARRLPGIKELLSGAGSSYLSEIYSNIDTLEDIAELISLAIVDEPPVSLKDGRVIKDSYDSELLELRGLLGGAKEAVARIESSEREKTGIKTLRVGYNRVFGYYIEMSRNSADKAPEHFIRKQTLASSERYITEELKALEEKILTAGERIERLEARIYNRVREQVCGEIKRVQKTAAALSRLDVFCSFAKVSLDNSYTRPQITSSGIIDIKSGRHPVVERLLPGGEQFVTNDVRLDMDSNRIALITGPNMAGKSTYMRMTALITIMAQLGCFVPAQSAECSVVDGVYTRVGASDDLASGQSTFMVEMSEVADILKNATKNSLIILDEIGRGTSTFDGMSIARAVVEYIADKKALGAKAMFATHYHELTELSETLSCLKNLNVSVIKRGEDVVFLRRIVDGAADDSYGIYVSKLAGIPEPVIKRANSILKKLEAGEGAGRGKSKPKNSDELQLSLPEYRQSEAVRRLLEIKPEEMTPIAALTLISELKNIAESETGALSGAI